MHCSQMANSALVRSKSALLILKPIRVSLALKHLVTLNAALHH